MPKMKTHSSSKKRFTTTGTGKVKCGSAKTSHMMMNKPKSMKAKAKGTTTMAEPDARLVLENFLPYSRKKKNRGPYNPELDPNNAAYKAPKAKKAPSKKESK
jgi:large subunit ribosomal protein L35